MGKPKLTPAALLKEIESEPSAECADAVFEAEVKEVLALTPEQRRRSLEDAGVDVDELHRQTVDFLRRKAPGRA
jgi:hypothetical protein